MQEPDYTQAFKSQLKDLIRGAEICIRQRRKLEKIGYMLLGLAIGQALVTWLAVYHGAYIPLQTPFLWLDTATILVALVMLPLNRKHMRRFINTRRMLNDLLASAPYSNQRLHCVEQVEAAFTEIIKIYGKKPKAEAPK